MASNRRRRDARRRCWGFWRKHQMVYSMRNEDRIMSDGTIKPGAVFETWSMRHYWVRRPR